MSIHSERELAVTREKLNMLEQQVALLNNQPAEDSHVRDLTLQSLTRHLKQLKEEIIRYEIACGRSVDLSTLFPAAKR
jgi:hypothetical protein